MYFYIKGCILFICLFWDYGKLKGDRFICMHRSLREIKIRKQYHEIANIINNETFVALEKDFSFIHSLIKTSCWYKLC